MKTLENVEIARVQEGVITSKELDDMKKNFDLNVFKDGVPLTIGHPDEETLAHGWVSKLKREGNRLLMDAIRVSEDFYKLLVNYQLKNRSVGYWKKLKNYGSVLFHVAFLGALAPGCEDMEPMKLNLNLEGGEYVKLNLNLEGVETFEQEILTKTKEDEKKVKEFDMVNYTEEQHLSILSASLETQKTTLKKEHSDEVTKLTTDVKVKDEKIEKLNTDITELNKKIEAVDIENFTAILIKDGKLDPAKKDATVQLFSMIPEDAKKLLKAEYSERKPLIELDKDMDHDDENTKEPEMKSLVDMDLKGEEK